MAGLPEMGLEPGDFRRGKGKEACRFSAEEGKKGMAETGRRMLPAEPGMPLLHRPYFPEQPSFRCRTGGSGETARYFMNVNFGKNIGKRRNGFVKKFQKEGNSGGFKYKSQNIISK